MNDAENPESPIVLGVIQNERRALDAGKTRPANGERVVEIDGNTIVVSAQETLTLRCGEASITLSRDGKIVIRGMHVVSHAAGANCIRGGSVQLN
jgi:hypothetical protein